jgi:hypothetical protein
MHCECHSLVYRALVTYANPQTGEIRVKIPSVIGNRTEVSISRITRAKYNGVWVVPNVGDQIVVSADDHNMTNVFWVHTDLTPAKTILPSNNYGSFYDTTVQTNPVRNAVNIMTINSSADHNLIDIVDGSKITVTNTGIFNIQFSAQYEKTDSGTDEVDTWLRIDGVDVPWSNTRLTLTNNNTKLVAAWNWMVAMNAGQYAQIAWSSDDAAIRLYAQTAQTGPTRPAIPSLIVTVQRTV